MYYTFTVVNTHNVRMYFVSGCQKKLRIIELAAATCYLQFCRATAWPGPEMIHWHPGGLSRNHFHLMDFITFIQSFCQWLYLGTCHFIKCLFNDILHLYGIRSLCLSFHSFAPLILAALSPRVSLAGGISSFPFWRKPQGLCFLWKYFSNIFGHFPICVSFTNDNMLHLYKSFIFKMFKFLCNIFVCVRLSSCKSNFNSLFCIVCILFTFLFEQLPYISIPYLILENTNAKYNCLAVFLFTLCFI